jgi:RHS repeat-associated protein
VNCRPKCGSPCGRTATLPEDPYGKVTVLDADFSADADNKSDFDNPYLYTGRILDTETGLYFFRARYYHPGLGEFVSRDPIRYEAGDPNVYRYVDNRATIARDPTGTENYFGSTYVENMFLDFMGGIREFVIGGRSVRRDTEEGRTITAQHESGRVGGMVGGGLDELTFRTGIVPLESCPTQMSAEGQEFGHVIVASAETTAAILSFRPRRPFIANPRSITGQLDDAYHYTYREWAAPIKTDGLFPGTYATPNGSLSGLGAKVDLALPPIRKDIVKRIIPSGAPNVRIRIDVGGLRKAGYDIPTPKRVTNVVTGPDGRVYTMPGGGDEIIFPYEIPGDFLEIIPLP